MHWTISNVNGWQRIVTGLMHTEDSELTQQFK
jgi:hypothetical protein